MTNKTVLSDEEIRKIADAFFTKDDDPDEGLCFARDVEQAVLQSPEIQQLRKDAERYQVLRNSDYQMLENDPCVADDCFNAFFGEDLDAAVDALKARRDAVMEIKP